MITEKTIQIQHLRAETLLNKLDGLNSKFDKLQSEVSKRNEPTDYLSRKQVAKLFNVSLVTIHDWTKKGILKAYKLANRVYFKRSELEASLTQIQARRAEK